jgi:hypothetical protein
MPQVREDPKRRIVMPPFVQVACRLPAAEGVVAGGRRWRFLGQRLSRRQDGAMKGGIP